MNASLLPRSPIRSFEMLRAKDLMALNPVSIRRDAGIREALELLTDRGFGAAPVIDEAGRPIGVVSRTDILIHERECVRHACPPDDASSPDDATDGICFRSGVARRILHRNRRSHDGWRDHDAGHLHGSARRHGTRSGPSHVGVARPSPVRGRSRFGPGRRHQPLRYTATFGSLIRQEERSEEGLRNRVSNIPCGQEAIDG